MRSALLAAAALLGTAMPISADDVKEDVRLGHELAKRWCVSCHVIGSDIAGGDAGPSLVEVANRPDLRPRDILVWLIAPHPPMPDLSLSQVEARRLTRYILSLQEE